jgi:hypothetical protein
MKDNSEQSSPSELLMMSFDFRVRSLRQLLSGELRPGERRLQVFQKRRTAFADSVFDSKTTQEHGQQGVIPEQREEANDDTTGESHESDEEERYKSASAPTMSTAAAEKLD